MANRNRPILSNVVARLVAYYAFWIGLVWVLYRLFPMLNTYIVEERARHLRTLSSGFDAVEVPGIDIGVEALWQPELLVPVAMAMFFSTVTAVPVAWVYTWSRSQRRTVLEFARTLVVVPLAISIVVFLVKGSLPLAFSLAGIVAAVRFRSSLEEPGDGVYLLIVIGIGLASGVQLLAVALIGSIFFVFAQLLVGRTKILRDDVVMIGWHLEKVAPLDTELVDPREVAIRVHTTDLGQAMGAIAPILEVNTTTYRHTIEDSDDPDVTIIRFDMKLMKKVKAVKVAREIEAAQIPGVTMVGVYSS